MHLQKIRETLFDESEIKKVDLEKEVVNYKGKKNLKFLFPVEEDKEAAKKTKTQIKKKSKKKDIKKSRFGEFEEEEEEEINPKDIILVVDIQGAKVYNDYITKCKNTISINTNFQEIFNKFGWDKHLTQLSILKDGFPQQRNFFNTFEKRINQLYDVVIFFSLQLINEFFYQDPNNLVISGMSYEECQMNAFRITKMLQKEVVNQLINHYNIKTN